MGASSRLRTFQYQPFWEGAGFSATYAPFFNERYLQELYKEGAVSKLNVLGCYLKRFWVLLAVLRYDLVWIEKELFPYLPAWAEWALAKLGKGYVVDYDDAVFHRYDQSSNAVIRKFLKTKIDRVMAYSDLVWAGNSYLGERAKASGAKKVVILPTVIDPKRYIIKDYTVSHSPVAIGWIGSPTTLKYLNEIRPVLERLSQEFDVVIHVVGGNRNWKFEGNLKLIQWTEEGEVAAIRKMDIGVMPLPDDPWERGKCAYKLIQYMACGLPVVASPVGMNVDVVKDGENGFLAKTQEEWYGYLKMLVLDGDLRRKMGEKGFELVLEKYTLERNFELMMKEIG